MHQNVNFAEELSSTTRETIVESGGPRPFSIPMLSNHRRHKSKIFLITFDPMAPNHLIHDTVDDNEPFSMVEPKGKTSKNQVIARPGQQRFRFRVKRRYGNSCLLCDVRVSELLDAAHIRPKKNQGSDDPRNGLLLCSLHHRAFDAQMFGIEPSNYSIRYRKVGPTKSELKIDVDDLSNVPNKPHPEALAWLWERNSSAFLPKANG